MNSMHLFLSGLALGFFVLGEHYFFYAAITAFVLMSGMVVVPVASIALYAITYTGLEIDFLLLGIALIIFALLLRRYLAFLR